MDIQRLRSLTTGRLHTDISAVYQDIELLTGMVVMTHEIPNAIRALEPHLRTVVPDARLWNGEYDPAHTGEIEIAPLDGGERVKFFKRFSELPSPLLGKCVLIVSDGGV